MSQYQSSRWEDTAFACVSTHCAHTIGTCPRNFLYKFLLSLLLWSGAAGGVIECSEKPAKGPNFLFNYFSSNLSFTTPLVCSLVLGTVADVRSFYSTLYYMLRYEKHNTLQYCYGITNLLTNQKRKSYYVCPEWSHTFKHHSTNEHCISKWRQQCDCFRECYRRGILDKITAISLRNRYFVLWSAHQLNVLTLNRARKKVTRNNYDHIHLLFKHNW